jgi:hypothetical protein
MGFTTWWWAVRAASRARVVMALAPWKAPTDRTQKCAGALEEAASHDMWAKAMRKQRARGLVISMIWRL